MKSICQTMVGALMLAMVVLPAGAQEWFVQHLESLEYPAIAVLAREQATLRIECQIRKDGTVSSADVIDGTPSVRTGSVLAKAARSNALMWRFRRSRAMTAPTEGRVMLIYAFRLVGVCETATCASRFSFDYPNRIIVTAQQRTVNH